MTEQISCSELKQFMHKERNYALFDVREPGEYNAGHISGATLLPRRDIEFRIADLIPVRDTPIFVAGDLDERDKLAATTIRRIGYKNVHVLEGGFPAWAEAGCPTATGVNVPSKEFGERVHIECAVPEIEPHELNRRAALGERITILDARTPEEYSRFCIPGGINVPGGELILRTADLMKDPKTTVVVNCAGRTRSIIGTETLRFLGLSNVYALKNGTMGWLLAGLDLEQQPNRETPQPSPESRHEAEALAARIVKEEKIPFMSVSELRDLIHRRHTQILYPIDVRSSEEYLSGHIPGFLWIPGGQAVQRADDYIAVRNGTIVFTCDRQARATMTAHWYRRMGFNDVRVLKGGVQAWVESGLELEKGHPSRAILGLERAAAMVRFVATQGLAERIAEPSNMLVLDVGTSLEYKGGHLLGALWISRGWLELKIPPLFARLDQPIGVTCPTGEQSTLAAVTLTELGFRNLFVLEGGVKNWQREKRPLETGLTRALIEPNDVVISASATGDKEAMRRYLNWEIELGKKYQNRSLSSN
ncbi:MAG: rhodanese-like domain-containing protein [Candidatus Binatia bacterium]